MRQSCRLILSALAELGVALATIGAGPSSACAPEATGAVRNAVFRHALLSLALGRRHVDQDADSAKSEVNSFVGPFELLGHLNGVPFFGAFEVRQGPLGFLADVIDVPVRTSITTHDVFFSGGTAELKAKIGTGLVVYRLLDQPTQFADAGLGVRAWDFSADVSLNPGLLAGTSINRSSGWGDPLIGGRYHYDFGNGFGATAYGDFGGFGVGAHVDWQVIGTFDYVLNSSTSFHLGYRSLNFNYQASSSVLGFNVHMKGPILAATLSF